MTIDPTWTDLVVAVVSTVLGWFARHFMPPTAPPK